jgi:hypothetical protein
MAFRMMRLAFLVALLLAGVVSATRFSDLSKRKGFGPNAKKRSSSNRNEERSYPQNFRFLTKQTKRECIVAWSDWMD